MRRRGGEVRRRGGEVRRRGGEVKGAERQIADEGTYRRGGRRGGRRKRRLCAQRVRAWAACACAAPSSYAHCTTETQTARQGGESEREREARAIRGASNKNASRRRVTARRMYIVQWSGARVGAAARGGPRRALWYGAGLADVAGFTRNSSNPGDNFTYFKIDFLCAAGSY